jgi:large conductance mechanosensitive channel
MYKDFMEFLKQYGVIGLAIAVIIGGKLNLLVTSLVNDLLTPMIFQPALKAAGVSHVGELSYHGIMYGRVVAALIDFLVVAFIIFYVSKKLMQRKATQSSAKTSGSTMTPHLP